MHHSRTRWLLLGLVSAAACLSSACGSSSSDGGDHAAAFEDHTAVSANVAGSFPGDGSADLKGATSKVDPAIRPGVEAPLDSMPDPASAIDLPSEPIDGAKPVPAIPTLRFASGFGNGVTLTAPIGFRNGDRYLAGSDDGAHAFPLDLWSTPAGWSSWVLSTVGEVTPAPVTDFLTVSLKNVASRNGGFTTALSLNSAVRSGGGGNQYIAVQEKGLAAEPVMFPRMWVKFDSGLAARAKATGASVFQQTFWEAGAPDYRMQLKLRHDAAGGLYWQATADRMDGGAPAWQADLKSVPVVMAAAGTAAGWHRVELWMDRPNGHFKVAIDGQVLVDHAGGLPGDSGNRIQLLRPMMFHGGKAQLGEMLFDDLEVWDAPPVDAWLAK